MELTPENLEKLEAIRNNRYFRQYTIDWIVNRAVEKYYGRFQVRTDYASSRETMKKEALRSQGYECFYCHRILRIKEATMDHLVPLARGGDAAGMSNLVICHAFCNQMKGEMTPAEFSKFVEQNPDWLEMEL